MYSAPRVYFNYQITWIQLSKNSLSIYGILNVLSKVLKSIISLVIIVGLSQEQTQIMH